MPIRKFIPGSSFDPDTIDRMAVALERICTILNVADPNDPLVETVAKQIISLTSQGTTDPDEITRHVIADGARERREAS